MSLSDIKTSSSRSSTSSAGSSLSQSADTSPVPSSYSSFSGSESSLSGINMSGSPSPNFPSPLNSASHSPNYGSPLNSASLSPNFGSPLRSAMRRSLERTVDNTSQQPAQRSAPSLSFSRAPPPAKPASTSSPSLIVGDKGTGSSTSQPGPSLRFPPPQRTSSTLRGEISTTNFSRTSSITQISAVYAQPRTNSKTQLTQPRTSSKTQLSAGQLNADSAPSSSSPADKEEVPPTQKLMPRKPGGVAKRPGAIPRKNKTFVDPDALFLVQIFLRENRFWTIAVNYACTTGDVLKSIATRVDDVNNAVLCVAEKKDLSVVRELGTEENMKDVKETQTPSQCFFLKQVIPEMPRRQTREDILAALSSTSASGRTMDDLAHTNREKARLSALIEMPSTRRGTVVGGARPRRTNSLPNLAIFVGTPSSFQWIDHKDVVKENKISKGAFAKVYRGRYMDQVVAIKTLKGELTEQQIHSFTSEFEIMSNVSSPRLVKFFGACVEPDSKLSMIMEFCPNGSLFDVMNDTSVFFDWQQTLTWFTEIVQGVEVLHTFDPPLVHRDIKSLNLLLDAERHIKVCDFGLSRFRTMTNLGTLGEIRGTMAYCPPEIYDGAIFNPKSDVYSLGVVLWEMCMRTITGEYKRPFSEYSDITFDFQIIVMTNKQGLRPTLTPQVPQLWKDVIELCWHQDPDMRPTCTGILLKLLYFQTELSNNPLFFGELPPKGSAEPAQKEQAS